AMWMCTQYFCTFFEAADAMLPPGIWQRDRTLYYPGDISLEEALSYILDDELVEVTPDTIRLRKRELDSNTRKKLKKHVEE
ncbi:MAG: hypothetical protein Q4C08_03385, partial [Pseudomonadota bacterium]|nr:hypothetical protein [Pseudomonadota bacterium]